MKTFKQKDDAPKKRGRKAADASHLAAAKRLREARLNRGRGLAEVASKAGVGSRQLAHMEKLLSPKASVKSLPSICAILNVSLKWVVSGCDENGLLDVVPAIKKDPETLALLGRRAKSRRQDLCLNVAHFAHKLSVSEQTFQYREKSLPSVIDPDFESLWEKELLVPAGWLRNADCKASDIIVTLDAQSIAGVARQLGTWATGTDSVYRSTDRKVLTASQRSALRVFLGRYYSHGRKISSIASEIGIGRTTAYEAIRRMNQRISKVRFDAPAVDAFKAICPIPPRLIHQPPEAIQDMIGKGFTVETGLRFIRTYFDRQ